MIRILTIAAVAAFVAVPAFAENAAPQTSAAVPAAQAQLKATGAALEARQHLVQQGYVNISTLEQDSLGRWAGSATKDGKTVAVAIKLPFVPGNPTTN
jgi:hypothetical protein